jgi:hypothetical protein
MNEHHKTESDRLRDTISYRITASQREFLEKVADSKGCGICCAARQILDDARKSGKWGSPYFICGDDIEEFFSNHDRAKPRKGGIND